MKPLNYTCVKCQNHTYKIGEMRATGSFLTKLLNMQTEKYSTVTCKNCSYTEFYKAKTGALSNIFDLFGG